MLDSSARRLVPGGVGKRALARLVTLLVTGLVTGLLTGMLTGCSEEQKAAPDPDPTPITKLDTPAMQVPRIEFCTSVPPGAISDALDGKPESETAYGNGDEEELPGIGPEIGTDVVHEIGCSWTGADGTAARAWVFARPVEGPFAETVIAAGAKTEGCRTVPGPAYGKPAATQLCLFPGGEQRVRHAGLFGQTWLTCELAATGGEPAELRVRADRWCVEVANALDTARR